MQRHERPGTRAAGELQIREPRPHVHGVPRRGTARTGPGRRSHGPCPWPAGGATVFRQRAGPSHEHAGGGLLYLRALLQWAACAGSGTRRAKGSGGATPPGRGEVRSTGGAGVIRGRSSQVISAAAERVRDPAARRRPDGARSRIGEAAEARVAAAAYISYSRPQLARYFRRCGLKVFRGRSSQLTFTATA